MKAKKLKMRKLTLNNVLKAVKNQPKQDKEIFGKLLLKIGIPKMKQVIKKMRKLTSSFKLPSMDLNFLKPISFFYMMV